jgi:bifunctional UDP-N-acetylglucosamine pyrophosphorylase/glucosamine-1-phosphate N-acetyltransferase
MAMRKSNKNIAAIILAAGEGTRMKSDLPKVLHPICERPMLEYVLDLVRDLRIKKAIAVLGHKHAQVRKFLRPGIKVAIQKKLLGTADALKSALPLLKDFKGTVLILYADLPLLKKETIKKLLKFHLENAGDVTILSAQTSSPSGYGRVLRDKFSSIQAIIEEKEADDFQKRIKEINTGTMCFDKDKLTKVVKRIRPNNRKKEYYLTDAIALTYKSGGLVESVKLGGGGEALGINSRRDLAKANRAMQDRINKEWMKKGVTIVDPDSAFIGYGAKIASDVTIYPFTVIESNVKIGKRSQIGPFAHLRAGTIIEENVVVGNFLEITRSKISPQSFIKHFGYIGDSRIGREVNIGAGTVTANFDGQKKHATVIKDKAFIGSDTVLVAPVEIGKAARTGAGSVVLKNKNVPDRGTVAGVPARRIKD